MGLPYENMDYHADEIGARNITELTDVLLTNLANDEILQYNSTNSKWENNALVTSSISSLSDTAIVTPITNGSSLVYISAAGKWVNTVLQDNNTNNLVDLTDTNISSVANNEILKYNSDNSRWENNTIVINEIADVNITSLQGGEVLKYNSSSSKWENQNNTDTLNELTDVTLSNVINTQVLKFNGSIFVNNFINLTELADTSITSLSNGDILKYNSTSSKWESSTFSIDDLTDVNLTNASNTQLLQYSSSSSKWVNINIPTWNQNTTGNAATATTLQATNGVITLTDDLTLPDCNVNNIKGSNSISSGQNRSLHIGLIDRSQYIEMTGAGNASGTGLEITGRGMSNGSERVTYGYNAGNGTYMILDLININGTATARLISNVISGGVSKLKTDSGSPSDDRLKFNESILTTETAISMIQQIQVKDYQKVNSMMTAAQEATFEAGGDGFAEYKNTPDDPNNPNSWFDSYREIGVIAQEIPQDLSFIVSEGSSTNEYKVKYENINMITTKVVQHLLEEITLLKARVTALEA